MSEMAKRKPKTITMVGRPQDHDVINALKAKLGMNSTSDLLRLALNELAVSRGVKAA